MEQKNYIEIWEQQNHVPDNQKLDTTMITKYLQPKVSRVRWAYNLNLLTYLVAIMASIVMLSMNLYGYRSNPIMLGVEAGLLILSLIFLGYGLYIFMKIREINMYTKDLRDLLHVKLRFLRFHYEIWLVLTAFVALILIFSLNTLVDNQEGIYRINKVPLYILVNLFVLVFIYGVQKLSSTFSMRELKGYMSDLESGYLEYASMVDKKRKKMRWILMALGLVLILIAVFGLLKGMGIL